MFSLAARNDRVDVRPYLRRICDLTTPNFASPVDDSRSDNRCNRAIPTLLCPFETGNLIIDDCTFALTKDVSDRGIGLLLSAPFKTEDLIVAFWLSRQETESPWFFRGTAVRNDPIGGGFWLLGVRLESFLNPRRFKQLLPIAANLLPPAEA